MSILLYGMLLCISIGASGCFLLRRAAGASYDAQELERAREVAVLELKAQAAERMFRKLSAPQGVNSDADIILTFTPQAVLKLATPLVGVQGWLDPSTTYVIKSIDTRLGFGYGLISMTIEAVHRDRGVKVDLTMDCALTIELTGKKVVARLEPFNVSPVVRAGGLLSPMEDLIADIVKIKVSTLSQQLPPVEFPVAMNQVLPMQSGTVKVRTGINMDVFNPARQFAYTIGLKDVSFFENALQVSLDIRDVRQETK